MTIGTIASLETLVRAPDTFNPLRANSCASFSFDKANPLAILNTVQILARLGPERYTMLQHQVQIRERIAAKLINSKWRK